VKIVHRQGTSATLCEQDVITHCRRELATRCPRGAIPRHTAEVERGKILRKDCARGAERSTLAGYSMPSAPQFAGLELDIRAGTVDQDRINQFAACTGDYQWIHVDAERARRESPFGGPVAHGYLILSLVAAMVMELGIIPPDAATGLNYGLDKVRFLAPVKAGACIRLRASLISAEPQNGGRVLLKLQCTLQSKVRPSLRSSQRSFAC
jgi:acyl dehydratase